MPFISSVRSSFGPQGRFGKKIPVLGRSSSNPASSAVAIKNDDPSALSGLYWITVAGTPREVYCDMSVDGGGWMLTYRCKNYTNYGCTNGTWDFSLALGAGGSNPPSSPLGNLSGLNEGLSPTNRWSLWNSSGSSVVRATAGTGTTVNIDTKYTGTYPDTGNMWLYAANGNNNNPTVAYSNTYVPGSQSSTSSPGSVNQVSYIFSNSFGLTNGSSYSLYSFGHYNCNCCEYYSINCSDQQNRSSTGVQLFGDGQAVSGYSQSYGGDWTSFWIK